MPFPAALFLLVVSVTFCRVVCYFTGSNVPSSNPEAWILCRKVVKSYSSTQAE